jgi:Protein of unknown function (DUF4231)
MPQLDAKSYFIIVNSISVQGIITIELFAMLTLYVAPILNETDNRNSSQYTIKKLLDRLFRKTECKDFEWYDPDNQPNVSDYVKKRLENQLNWYDKKAKSYLYRYYEIQILILGVSALIPIVNVVGGYEMTIRIISSILGSIVVGATGILQLTKAQESWIIFRSTAETLKKEYNLYMLKAGDYSDTNLADDKRDKLFIERSESVMAMEGTKYFSLRQKSESSAKNQT